MELTKNAFGINWMQQVLHDLETKIKYELTASADNPKLWHLVGTGQLVYYKKHCVTQGWKYKESKGTE